MVAATLALGVLVTACGGDPPQIVDYSPQRNSVDVSTASPIRITFDHDVDRQSVEARLHLSPITTGSVQWLSGRQLAYNHATLRTNTPYEVILEPGYRDLAGNTYTLRHHWSFVTEGAPTLAGSTPTDGESGIDPASYLTLDFTREMDAQSLQSAIAITPNVPIDVRLDPTDGRRAIIATSELLTPNTAYQLLVNTAALDVDGNPIDRDQLIQFNTGAQHPLRHWIAFATNNPAGGPGGLWIVDERGFPRILFDSGAVQSFSWSPAGDSMLIEVPDETWWTFSPGGTQRPLNVKAVWAAALASGMGFVYIDNEGVLYRQTQDGVDERIASDVAEAVVAPDGLRLAFVGGVAGNEQIWGYDVGLRAGYQLVQDSGPVSDVAWSPGGTRLAYLRHDATTTTLRVRSLVGTGATSTLTTGDLGSPAWLPDSTHIVFSAAFATDNGTVHKAFVVNVVSPPTALTIALGLPSDPGIDAMSPISSPDGHQIAFLSGNQVWLMNADGTRPTALTKQDPASFPYSCRALAWTRT